MNPTMSSTETVLVVDNDRELRDLIRAVLEHRGLNVVTTCDGQEAFRYLTRHSLPSLVLLDFNMPNMDGFQFRALQLKDERLRAVPVVFMTAIDQIPEQRDDLAHVRCLKKPFEVEDLLNAVAHYVATPRSKDET